MLTYETVKENYELQHEFSDIVYRVTGMILDIIEKNLPNSKKDD
jgi:hypothetical protein